MKNKLRIRPMVDDDRPFLYQVFASTRTDIADSPLDESQKEALMRSQFKAQHDDYVTRFPKAEFGVILVGKSAVGRLYLNRTRSELHVVEISILPEHRANGIGSTLMKDIQKEAKASSKSVRIHVIKQSPAVAFYKKHGFEQIGEKQFHLEMEWSPTK